MDIKQEAFKKQEALRASYDVRLLLDHVKATYVLTGEEPKEIVVSKDFLEWYKNQLRLSWKELGLAKAFKLNESLAFNEDNEFEFKGIKLVVK